jgi:tryptophan-rich sensory protein
MGVRVVVAICLVLGALWDLFTTFYGISRYFDLPMNPNINPGQFLFALVVTMVVFGFVISTHLVFDAKQDDIPAFIKGAVLVCIAIDLVTAWEGTKRFVFYGDDGDAARGAGLAVVTALIVSSTIFLPKLIGKNADRPPPRQAESGETGGGFSFISIILSIFGKKSKE